MRKNRFPVIARNAVRTGRLLRTAAPAALVLGLMGAGPLRAAPAADAAAAPSARGSFAVPRMADRPMYRFWNNGGMMTPQSITSQVAEIKAAGAGGFEANQLSGVPSVSTVPGYDPARHAFGTPEWTRAWTQLFQAGKAQGLRVDQIYTPGWSAGIQGLSPDLPGTMKEISFGSVVLGGGETFDGAVPVTELPGGVAKRVLLGLVAYRCTANCASGAKGAPLLDARSAADQTAGVVNGRIRYTAPAGEGRYVLVAAWMHGTGQVIDLARTPTTSYMVDHFAKAGAQAIIDYWENKVLTPGLRQAFRASGGSLFIDSFELNRQGKEVRHWTDDFLAEFAKRRGYSLVPYLAGVADSDKPAFAFEGDIGERVREDYRQTLSELFVANHLVPIREWAHSYGMSLRAQGYAGWGPTFLDNADAATAIDIPEQEANNHSKPLFSTDAADAWRQVASANAQVGRTIVSSETGTFGRTDGLARVSLVTRINETMGLGMNQVVYHGWPDQTPGGADKWPGYLPFAYVVGDNYGPQFPTFADDVTINAYVARLQTVLRRGELRDEIALYWGGPGEAHDPDLGLERAGYTYGFMDDALIAHPTARIAGGRLTRLGYKAFVLDPKGSGIPISLASARRLLSWAKDGFPVFVVGELPTRVGGYHPADDLALHDVWAGLLAQRSVTRVGDRAGVVAALRKAGIGSAASYDAEPIVTLHRQTADSDYYFLFNAASGRTTASVDLEGRGAPYRYDAWTGAVRAIPVYTRTASGVRVTVDLATGDGELIALTPGNADVNVHACQASANSTTGDELLSGPGGGLVLRAAAAGRYTTRLSGGGSSDTVIARVPPRTAPASWTLRVTSWQAGATPNETAKVALAPIVVKPAADGKLPDWQHVAGLEAIAGTATYTASLDLGRAWSGGAGAYLDLGSVLGTAQVSVNGKRLPPLDQADLSRIDLGGYLKPGANRLEVHVATPLYNAAFHTKSPYGLVGPVMLVPYGQAAVPGACARR